MTEYFERKDCGQKTEYLEKQSLKVSFELNAADYFHEILKEGYRLFLISSEHLEKLQYQLLELLTGQFHHYTSGQSSSVPVEIGQRIQQSVFYTVGYFLKNLSDAETGLQSLKNNSLTDLYLSGKNLIEAHWKDGKSLLETEQENCLDTDVLAYNDTLHTGLSLFFQSYDMDYGTHETTASIDYPLSNDNMNLTGIEYMLGYLQKLQMENMFCSCFPAEEIHSLLKGYDSDYKELLFNIYDLVLTNAIGSELLGRDEIVLRITEYDRRYLFQELSCYSKKDLDRLIDAASSRLCAKLSLSDPRLKKYVAKTMVNLKTRLKHALETDGLQHLFLSPSIETANQITLFKDNMKLDDGNFRILAKEIRECRLISDKIVLLGKDELSMKDLIDLLEGDCFFGEEYMAVFQSMEEIRLALLVKQIPLDPADTSILIDDSSPEWQHSFKTFLTGMDNRRKSAILSLADRISTAAEDKSFSNCSASPV